MPEPSSKIVLTCMVNGQPQTVQVYPMARLLDVLREELRLTGAKEGCGEGECGACAVLLDGELVNSCLVPAAQVQSAEIITIEGIAGHERLHAVQKAFIECGGAQCGICTPGMLMAALDVMRRNSQPSEGEIRSALAGNLCRCTGYTGILKSILEACRRPEAGA